MKFPASKKKIHCIRSCLAGAGVSAWVRPGSLDSIYNLSRPIYCRNPRDVTSSHDRDPIHINNNKHVLVSFFVCVCWPSLPFYFSAHNSRHQPPLLLSIAPSINVTVQPMQYICFFFSSNEGTSRP